MATKKKTAAAAADTQTESAAAAAPMTENTTPTAPAKVKVRFVKRCEVSALRVTCAPGATMTLTAELAAKLESAGFARVVGI